LSLCLPFVGFDCFEILAMALTLWRLLCQTAFEEGDFADYFGGFVSCSKTSQSRSQKGNRSLQKGRPGRPTASPESTLSNFPHLSFCFPFVLKQFAGRSQQTPSTVSQVQQ